MKYLSLVLLCLFSGFTSCTAAEVSRYKIKVEEPSDLCYEAARNCLWTVSDEDGKVYRLSLEGKILDVIDVEGYDLEGIALSSDGSLFILDEYDKEVWIHNSEGEELGSFSLKIESPSNNGPEGIYLDEDNQTLYVLNEKNPGLLQAYTLKGDLLEEWTLDFASDYSAVSYDHMNNRFMILSDEDRTLYAWTIEDGLQTRMAVNIETPEGVCMDKKGALYLVSDEDEELLRIDPEDQSWSDIK